MSLLLRAASAAGQRLVRPPSSACRTMVHGLRRSMASSSAIATTVLRHSMASSAAATTVQGGRSVASSCRCRETMEGRWMITLAKWGLIWKVGHVVVDMKVEDETTSIREDMLLLEEEASSIREEMLLLHASNAEVQASNAELQELMEPYINRWRAKKQEN